MIQYAGALLPDLRMAARDVRVLDLDVALARAAEHDAVLVDALRLPVPREDGDLAVDAELLGDTASVGCGPPSACRSSSRRTRPRSSGSSAGRLAALRLHHPRRDPELAEREVVVGLEQDLRRREERVVLALRVLGEVLLELRDERVLVALELLAVGGREVDVYSFGT